MSMRNDLLQDDVPFFADGLQRLIQVRAGHLPRRTFIRADGNRHRRFCLFTFLQSSLISLVRALPRGFLCPARALRLSKGSPSPLGSLSGRGHVWALLTVGNNLG